MEKILVNAKKKYGNRVVLNVRELSLEYGKKYAIIGANGSGKSTLLKAIAKQIPFEGEISIDKKIKSIYMPQQNYGFSMSVMNNLRVVYRLQDLKFRRDEAIKLLKDLDILHLKNKNAARLSGGETQRVALARALSAEADLLILDEFTAAMDINQAQNCQNLVDKKIKDRCATLVFTTHSMYQAEALADYIIFLHEGEVAETIDAKDFIENAKSSELRRFLAYMLNKPSEISQTE